MDQKTRQVAPAAARSRVEATDREWLIHQLRRVLEIALDKVTHPKTPPGDRIKWSRVVVAAGQACNSILRDVEIETLKQQIEELKELTQERLSDDQNGDQEEHPTTKEED